MLEVGCQLATPVVAVGVAFMGKTIIDAPP
jgi:hypothetical protein